MHELLHERMLLIEYERIITVYMHDNRYAMHADHR